MKLLNLLVIQLKGSDFQIKLSIMHDKENIDIDNVISCVINSDLKDYIPYSKLCGVESAKEANVINVSVYIHINSILSDMCASDIFDILIEYFEKIGMLYTDRRFVPTISQIDIVKGADKWNK